MNQDYDDFIWSKLEKMREEVIDSLSKIEIAALDQDFSEFRRLYEEENEYLNFKEDL